MASKASGAAGNWPRGSDLDLVSGKGFPAPKRLAFPLTALADKTTQTWSCSCGEPPTADSEHCPACGRLQPQDERPIEPISNISLRRIIRKDEEELRRHRKNSFWSAISGNRNRNSPSMDPEHISFSTSQCPSPTPKPHGHTTVMAVARRIYPGGGPLEDIPKSVDSGAGFEGSLRAPSQPRGGKAVPGSLRARQWSVFLKSALRRSTEAGRTRGANIKRVRFRDQPGLYSRDSDGSSMWSSEYSCDECYRMYWLELQRRCSCVDCMPVYGSQRD